MLKKLMMSIGAAVCAVSAMIGTSAPASAANEMKDVTLTVYLYPIGVPNAFFKENLRDMQGIDVDIIEELQRRLGFDLTENRIFPAHYSTAFSLMAQGKVDLVGGGLSFTQERSIRFAASSIYQETSMGVMYSPAHNPDIKSFNDLKGKKVYADPNIFGQYMTAKFGKAPEPIPNLTLAMFDVAAGRVDAIVYDKPPLIAFDEDVSSVNVDVLPESFAQEYCRYVFYMPRVSPYRTVINKTINDMIYDGTLKSILQKWGQN